MADKEIVQLPASSGVTDETLFPAYHPGAADLAQKVTAKQIRKYVENTSTLAEDIRRLSAEVADMFVGDTLSWDGNTGFETKRINPDYIPELKRLSEETWVFELEDGSTVSKQVVMV